MSAKPLLKIKTEISLTFLQVKKESKARIQKNHSRGKRHKKCMLHILHNYKDKNGKHKNKK